MRRSQIMLCVVLVAAPLVAGTVSIQATSDLPLTIGSSTCADSSIRLVFCSIWATFGDPLSHKLAASEGTASADFGSLFGAMYVGGEVISGFYQSSFSDFVTVLGGSGAGTLTTHYRLFSSDTKLTVPGHAVPPSYR